MAGGVYTASAAPTYEGRVTVKVIITCLVAAMGGLIFGYDIGISGGVTSMDPFLRKFFPAVYRKMNDPSLHQNSYCKFDSQVLQLFTSSLYIAALIASLFASTVTRNFGRKNSMVIGGIVFLVGAIVNGFAKDIAMLIIGRIFLGIGVGFANQSVPVYLSEMAPPKLRGALNMGFQLAITIGILAANLINYATNKIEAGWGWRVSLGLAAVPAVMMTLGSLCLPDTPNSLIERGYADEAKAVLKNIRGADDVDEEFSDLIEASEAGKKIKHPMRTIVQGRYRPMLIITIAIPFFQQVTGINVIMFYAPVLFKILGFGDDAALMSAVITGLVNVLSTLISIVSVDKVGRRPLFLEGGMQMFVSQVAIAVILGIKFGTAGTASLSKGVADLVLVLICVYVGAFAWSWGPLGWLVPSEICPLEVRSAGQAINVSVNMAFTFVIAQAFLTMLCHLKFGLFLLFGGFVLIMTIFVFFLLPETKNVPIEEMNRVWKAHWFWGRFIPDDAPGLSHDHHPLPPPPPRENSQRIP